MVLRHSVIENTPPLHVAVARGFMQRARGLLFRAPLAGDEALLIPRCASVHTFGMRYPIDVVFLDTLGRVLKVVPSLGPWRLAMQLGAVAVLELAPGRAKEFGFDVGAQASALKPFLAGH